MTATQEKIIKDQGFLPCPNCEGSGEITSFCGHEVVEGCCMCAGHGVVRSLQREKHKKPCGICEGQGGPGCCENKGFHEWESFELVTSVDDEA